MMRLGGPEGDSSEEDRRMANSAVIANVVTFAIAVISIHFSPYLLEQFGLEVVK
jgi:hypothetical protein